MTLSRRQFLTRSAAAAAACSLSAAPSVLARCHARSMRIGLVTYLWGADWTLPTIIDNCEQSGVLGVELRTQHKHGVEPSLSEAERREVRKRFADSPVELVGYGSNAQFHDKDPEKVAHNIELTKQYVRLMHDCGGSGVKVKPNALVPDVPPEKTIAQIGQALNVVGAYGAQYGQEIRLEVHGRETQKLPIVDRIMEVADHPNVGVCWNCNQADLAGDGLEANFRLVQDRLAETVHVREMNEGSYPYDRLFELLQSVDYAGWILLECRRTPDDPVAAMAQQKRIFQKLTAS